MLLKNPSKFCQNNGFFNELFKGANLGSFFFFDHRASWSGCFGFLLSDSNTNVNSMINKRVSLFYDILWELPTIWSVHVCEVCPGTSELVGQHPPPISISASENGDCQR